MQLMGMSNSAASVMVALYLLCGGLGGLLGGWIGDKVAARWPDHGRIAATQFSVIIGVPFALLIFKVRLGWVGERGWAWQVDQQLALGWHLKGEAKCKGAVSCLCSGGSISAEQWRWHGMAGLCSACPPPNPVEFIAPILLLHRRCP